MMKKYIVLYFILGLVYACEPENIVKEQLEISSSVPESVKLGTRDTLNFKITSFDYSIQLVELSEIIGDSDTVTLAKFDERGKLGYDKYYLDINFLYDPNDTGEKRFHFYAQCGDVYTRVEDFRIMVTE